LLHLSVISGYKVAFSLNLTDAVDGGRRRRLRRSTTSVRTPYKHG